MSAMAMPRRAAVSRSMTSVAPRPWSCRSLATSVTIRLLAQLLDHPARVDGQLGWVGIFERVLEFGAADAVFDGQVLQRLQEELDAFDVGQLGLQAADDLGGARSCARRAA